MITIIIILIHAFLIKAENRMFGTQHFCLISAYRMSLLTAVEVLILTEKKFYSVPLNQQKNISVQRDISAVTLSTAEKEEPAVTAAIVSSVILTATIPILSIK